MNIPNHIAEHAALGISATVTPTWMNVSEGITGNVKLGFNTRLGTTQQGFDNRFASNMATLNCHTMRDVPSWPRVQTLSTEPYTWNVSGLTGLASMLAQLVSGGFVTDWNFILSDFGPSDLSKPWTTGGELTSLGAFATEVVTHYNAAGYTGKFRLGFGNEFNALAPTSTPSEYYTQLATVYAAVKAADSTVKVGAPVGLDLDWTGGYTVWLDGFLATNWANNCDFFDHHVYSDGGGSLAQVTPEELTYRMELIHSRVLNKNARIPISISEMGWYTEVGTNKITRTLQAQYYSRFPFLLRSLPNVTDAQFFELKDAATAGYGIMLSNWTAKSAFATLTNVIPIVQQASTAKRYVHSNGTSIMVAMDHPSGRKYALWDTSGPLNMPITVVSPASGTLRVTDMMSGSTTDTAFGAGKTLLSIPIDISAVVVSSTTTVNYRLAGIY